MSGNTADSSLYDGSVVQLVPQQVEKLPLYHWKPGNRLLCVGSRDGAVFDGDVAAAERNTYRRPLSVPLLQTSLAKLGCDGLCACMSASLCYPNNIEMLLAAQAESLVLATAAYGDPAVWRALQPQLDALLLLRGPKSGPLEQQLVESSCHCELLLGIETDVVRLDLPWTRFSAVHVTALHQYTSPELRADWYRAVREQVPVDIPVYDADHQHSLCDCGAVLVRRHGGHSRFESLDPDTAICRDCGKASGICC